MIKHKVFYGRFKKEKEIANQYLLFLFTSKITFVNIFPTIPTHFENVIKNY